MIPSHELRIGDIVKGGEFHNKLSYYTIATLHESACFFMEDQRVTSELYSELIPMPLNDSTIQLFDDVRKLSCKEPTYRVGGDMIISYTEYESEFIDNYWKFNYLLPGTPVNCPRSLQLKYVHQLQNLYADLQGKPLLIKK